MMTYLLQASGSILIFFLFYLVFLKNNKFFNLQRIYLMSTALLSVIIPLVDFSWFIEKVQPDFPLLMNAYQFLEESAPVAASSTSYQFKWMDVVFVIYFLGLSLAGIRLLYKAIQLIKIIVKSEKVQKEGYTLVFIKDDMPMASFYKYIFINAESDLTSEKLEFIFIHEQKHISDKHSFDLMLMELIKLVLWFHPVVYWYVKSVRDVHEFVCDHEVIKHTSLNHYEKILISSLFQRMNIPVLSQFSEVSIKNRIYMMNQKQPEGFLARLKKLRFLLAIPVAAILIIACNQENLPMATSEKVVSGKVLDVNGKGIPGVNIVVTGTQIGSVSNIEGFYKVKVPANSSTITYSFIGYTTEKIGIEQKSIIDVTLGEEPNSSVGNNASTVPKLMVKRGVLKNDNKLFFAGEVLDEDGQPVSGVTLKISSKTNNGTMETFEISENGKFMVNITNQTMIASFEHDSFEAVYVFLHKDIEELENAEK